MEKPYEKYLKYGVEFLSDSELFSMILRSGTAGKSVFDIADEILAIPGVKQEGLSGLLRINKHEIEAIKGIGSIKASQILCIIELSRRISSSKANVKLSFESSKKAATYFMDRMRSFDREHVLLVCLNSRLQMISEEVLYIGTVNSSILCCRDVFSKALLNKAASIMIFHNHPSGDPSPSDEDIKITLQLKNSGQLLQLPLIDHIIIGDNNYYSMKEQGII